MQYMINIRFLHYIVNDTILLLIFQNKERYKNMFYVSEIYENAPNEFKTPLQEKVYGFLAEKTFLLNVLTLMRQYQ